MILVRLVMLAVLVALGACASDGGTQEADPEQPPTEDVVEEPTQSASGVEVRGNIATKPTITIPDGEPPAQLEITDLVEGDGAEVEADATVTAHYVGVAWSTGQQFDASWDRGQPVAFPLDEVIPGWTQGLPGMREGGRRLLVIPPEMGYADNPPPGSGIEPGETLVFVVDMVGSQ